MSMKYWRHLEQDEGVLASEGGGVDPASRWRVFFSTGSSLNPLCLNKIVLWNLQSFHF